ncbi:hypothetical protein H6F46_09150 [Limnothrix sp. FACHB-1083]|nr:hypothetical protein [Limnothrix sp. FACHB-1083]MBD2191560.1 hypothetical protein [Limnothrix sp. FACHB-1088]
MCRFSIAIIKPPPAVQDRGQPQPDRGVFAQGPAAWPQSEHWEGLT